MVENALVHEIYLHLSDRICISDNLASYLNTDTASLCQFLYFLDINEIASYVESCYYSNKDWHFRHKISSMIKLIVVKCFRNLSYKKTISTLTKEEVQLLSFEDNNGIMNLSSPATLHHFVKYRLGENGLDEVMFKIGKKISKITKIRNVKTD
jgi:phosphate starvation-inducible membrane PsiE